MSNLLAYRTKTEAELHFIIKDAGEAATAMRGHDPVAEAKYLDQVNDACTTLNARRRPQYSVIAVNAAIESSRRAGRKISRREAKLIHGLLKGRG